MSTPKNNISPATEAVVPSLNFSQKTLLDYEVISVIGTGAFGTCFKVRDKDNGQIYAWKVIHYDELKEAHRKSLGSEIRVLRQLRHPNIVQYFHHLVNYEAKSIFIIMEYCEGGDLAQLIAKAKVENKRFEEHYIWRVLYHICRALCVCHNKIKECTILHRDIKPANIFLDGEGNAKLGDFGLARLLRRNETFADTFVGTPYYMSPEIIKGSKYDRKSDVWAVGCLIYEMCCLQPPFKGAEFNQLSMNISMGKFNSIPGTYSKDLQEIIAYMLEVKNEQRPSIEVLFRHPILIRNIQKLGNDFPVLVDVQPQCQDSYGEFNKPRKLEYSPLQNISSAMLKEQNSFAEGYGQRCLSFTSILTSDLKSELFYSAKRKIFSVSSKLQISDPELYESIRLDVCPDSTDPQAYKQQKRERYAATFKNLSQPYEVTRHVFNDMLQERLRTIRAQESLLRQREESLDTRERQLNEKEKRLIAFQQSLVSQCQLFKQECRKKPNILSNSTIERLIMALPEEKERLPNIPPPVPPKKPPKHDDTYCSIESNDTSSTHQPTMAKLNMATLPAPRAFPRLRKVTFQSPKRIFTYHIKNKNHKSLTETSTHTSTSSKSSEELSESAAVSSSSSASTTKRKSILSIFSLRRNNKESTNPSSIVRSDANAKAATTKTEQGIVKERKSEPPAHQQEEHTISKYKTSDLTNIWTKEHKKAAFEMLAAMNAAESSNNGYFSNAPRHKIRQSVRDRNSLQRSCLGRSLMASAPLSNSHQIFI